MLEGVLGGQSSFQKRSASYWNCSADPHVASRGRAVPETQALKLAREAAAKAREAAGRAREAAGKAREAAPFQSSHSPLAGGLAAEPDSLFALDVLRQRLHEKIQEARGQVGGGDFGVPGAPFAAVVSPLRGGSQRCRPSWAWPAFL